MPTEYSEEQKSQAKAAVLIADTLKQARDLLGDIWDTRSPPSKSTLSQWNNNPLIAPDLKWVQGVYLNRMEHVQRGALEMYTKTKARYFKDLPAMSWKDVQHAQFALGILADKLLPKKDGINTLIFTDNRVQVSGGRDVNFTFEPRDVNFVFEPREAPPVIEAEVEASSDAG